MSIRRTWLWLSLVALPLGGCASERDVHTGDGQYFTDEESELAAELTDKYGLRPRRYNGFFNGDNEAEKRFLAHLPALTAEMNERAPLNGYAFSMTEAEVATNFITEGGFYLLDGNITDSNFGESVEEYEEGDLLIDGFSYLGVDTFGNNLEALTPWMPDNLYQAFVNGEIYIFDVENELGQTVTSIVVQTIEQGMDANATMFAWSRALVADDLAAFKLPPMNEIAPEAAFFFTTMYFNAGPGFGEDQLRDEGIDHWQDKWTSPDDPTVYSKYARYNALWRTSSWEFMERTVYQ